MTDLMKEKGLNFLIGYKPVEIKTTSENISKVTLKDTEGEILELDGFDCVVLAVGRDFHHQNINYLALKDARINAKR